MPPPDHFSVDADQVLKTWRILLIKAQDFSDDESALYPLIDHILNTFAILIDTDDDTTVSCHPQLRLSGNNAYEHILSLTHGLSVIPDFALILDHLRGIDFNYARVLLLFEIKRLVIPPPSPKPGLQQKPTWFNSPLHMTAISEFRDHLDQIMLQGFVSWHVYKQEKIYLVLVMGIYYTLLCFTRPDDASLAPLPTHSSKVDLFPSKLVPREYQPKPIVFMKPMFEQQDDGTVELADSFRRLLRLGLLHGKGVLPGSARPFSLFHLEDPSVMDFELTAAEQAECSICTDRIHLWYDDADEHLTAKESIAVPKTPARVVSEGRLSFQESPSTPGAITPPELSPYIPPKTRKKRRLTLPDDEFQTGFDSSSNRLTVFKRDGLTLLGHP